MKRKKTQSHYDIHVYAYDMVNGLLTVQECHWLLQKYKLQTIETDVGKITN